MLIFLIYRNLHEWSVSMKLLQGLALCSVVTHWEHNIDQCRDIESTLI